MTIPFVYNILKRHPALMCMIHRDGTTPEPFEGVPLIPRVLRLFIQFDVQIPFWLMNPTQT